MILDRIMRAKYTYKQMELLIKTPTTLMLE